MSASLFDVAINIFESIIYCVLNFVACYDMKHFSDIFVCDLGIFILSKFLHWFMNGYYDF